ncbi:MAG: XdhC family protein [Alphaproteobacteria bacterium]|nr:XdhC family protein [Alphaproteobacteria bacterium]
MASGTENKLDSDALSAAIRWQEEGHSVALAIVMATWGSSPRPVGSLLAARDDGLFTGSVSGGCVEGAVLLSARQVIADGKPRRQSFGISDEDAWAASLACGGSMEVLILRPPALSPLQEALHERRASALALRLDGSAWGIVAADRKLGSLLPSDLALARTYLIDDRTALDETGQFFVCCFAPRPRLLIVGATHIAQVLAEMAPMAGFDVAVIDPRPAFGDPARFQGTAHHQDDPARILPMLGLDERTGVVTLTHQPRIDEEALALALDSPCFYIGALGSKKTHAARLAKLGRGQDRIHGPIGLDIGARTASEIAVAILAEAIQAWRKGRHTS